MKCSLGITNFLEETSSLSHSIVFLYFFALVTEEGFIISSCYSLELLRLTVVLVLTDLELPDVFSIMTVLILEHSISL